MSEFTSARLYLDEKGRACCELKRPDGTAFPRRLLGPGELEQCLAWCGRIGLTVIDDRDMSMQARERLDNEAALYKLERP